MTSRKIGYLVSEYPAPSHTFIRREVEVLRRQGVDITTFSIHKPGSGCRFGTEDQRALTSTRYLFPVSPLKVLTAHVWAIAKSPRMYLKAWAWSMQHAAPGWKEFFWRWFYFYEAIVLARMLSDGQVQHLHSHFANSAARVGAIATKFLEISWSITLHGAADWEFPNGHLLPEKMAAARFVACVSHYTRSQAMLRTPMLDWKKMFIARCGIDLGAFSRRTDTPRDGTVFRILNIGRLVPEKAQVGLIEALSSLRAQGQKVELKIVGSGPLKNLLTDHIVERGVKSSCTLVGQLTEAEIRDELRQADAFVMTSLMEGLPVVLMEAMAMGVPVVAPGIAGIPELVEHERTGLLFSPGDWEGLARQITQLVNDASMRGMLSEAAFQKVAQFHDIEISLDSLKDHFIGLAKQPMPPHQIDTISHDADVAAHSGSHPTTLPVDLAYLAPELPALSETFVYQELLALERLGVFVLPLTLRKPDCVANEQMALQARCETVYGRSKIFVVATGLFNLFKMPGARNAIAAVIHDCRELGLSVSALKVVFQFLAGANVARLLRSRRVAHLHVHFAHVSGSVGMYAALMAEIPFTVVAHANDIFQHGILLKEKAERSHRFLTISNFNIAYLRSLGLPEEKLAVVRCGVSFKPPSVWPQAVVKPIYRVGTLGRLVEKKGVDVLLEAISGLPKVQLSVAGDGPLLEELKAKSAALGMASSVEFVGSLSHCEVAGWMAGLDVFALACKQDRNGDMDGIPVVLMEAMSQGIPVVSTRLSGIPELVIDGKTGLLAAPGDVSDLRAKLSQMLGAVELRNVLARAAAEHVREEFGQAVNIDRLLHHLALPTR